MPLQFEARDSIDVAEEHMQKRAVEAQVVRLENVAACKQLTRGHTAVEESNMHGQLREEGMELLESKLRFAAAYPFPCNQEIVFIIGKGKHSHRGVPTMANAARSFLMDPSNQANYGFLARPDPVNGGRVIVQLLHTTTPLLPWKKLLYICSLRDIQ